MGKSGRLKLREVRDVFRLAGESRELGADPSCWRSHVAARLPGLVAAQVGFVGESTASPGPGKLGQLLHTADAGWTSEKARVSWLGYLREAVYRRDPVIIKIFTHKAPAESCLREEMIAERDWYGSELYHDYLKGAEIDDCLFSFQPIARGARLNGLVLFRQSGARRFGPRERRLTHLLHRELSREFGKGLATTDDPSPLGLPPRQRQVLVCLLEGDGEKQVACRLGLSPATVHGYVKAVYAHFGVASRPELLAHFLRRTGLRLDGGPTA